MSSPPLPVPPEFSLNLMSTFGAVLAGSFLSAAIWGVSTFQTFLYFMKYDTDPIFLKILIASLWVIDTANEVLVMKSNFRVPIVNWGLLSGVTKEQLELMDHVMIESVVVLSVQLYFIWRIYMFSKKKWLFPAFLVVLASWQVVGTIVYQVYGYGRALSSLATPREVNLNISLRAAAVAVDISTTTGMVYLLASQNSPQFQRSKRMINRLIVICVNSGMVTAVVATTVLILQAASPDTLYYVIPELMLCSLYFSTFLANLNARRYVRGSSKEANSSSFVLASASLPSSGLGGDGKDTSVLSWGVRSGPVSSSTTTTTGSNGTSSVGDAFSGTASKGLDLEKKGDIARANGTKLVVKVQTEAMDDASYD